jgi:hypothetical protein
VSTLNLVHQGRADRRNDGRRDYCTEIIVEPFFRENTLPSSGFGDLFAQTMVKRVRKKLNWRKGDTKQYPAAWAATSRHIGMRIVTGGMVSRRRGKSRPGVGAQAPSGQPRRGRP